ncbi:MAG TPA: hypothetical protein VGM85_12905 [Paraburkholderia sp.]|jgi:uncharacterized membrane protein
MKKIVFMHQIVEDRFAVAQVALLLFSVLDVGLAVMTVFGAVFTEIGPQESTMQRLSATINSVINILCFAAGYLLLAGSLDRCTRLVWHIAFGIFLLNVGLAALALVVHRNLFPVLTGSLAIAGAISVWNGRGVIQIHSSDDSNDRPV